MNNNTFSEDMKKMAVSALSSIGDGIIITDKDGKITFMNQSSEVILGIYAGDVTGKEFDSAVCFLNADTKQPNRSPVMSTIQKGVISGLEYNTVIITRDNIQKYVSATCSPMKSEENILIGTVTVLRDITRIKKDEIINTGEKNSLLTIFSNSPVGMVILDSNYITVRVNDAALAYTDKGREQVLGMPFGWSLNCTVCKEGGHECGVSPECSECRLRKAIAAAIHEGWSSRNIEIFTALSVNGAAKNFWFRISVAPVLVNGVSYALATLIDITAGKDKERYLEESRNYAFNLLNQVPSLVWKANNKLECDYVNQVWTDYTGTTVKESSGLGWASLMHPKDVTKFLEIRDNSSLKMASFQVEARILRHDGIYRWCLIAGAPYYDLDGRSAGYLGSVYDINAQKEFEESLRRYRKVIDNARDIMFLLDPEGRILETNKSAADTYGYSMEELKNMNIKDIRIGGSPDYLSAGGKALNLYETVHCRRDGSRFPVEVSTQEVLLDDNRIILKVVRDITERKRAEKKVLESQIKYRSLFMNMQAGFAYMNMICDENHNIIDLRYKEINEAFERLFNVSKKRIINKTHKEIFPSTRDRFVEAINENYFRLARGENIQNKEAYLPDLDRWLLYSIYSPKENDLVIIIADITEGKLSQLNLKSAKEAAEAANKAKSEFLANMSHEIRTPINGIVGMVDLTLLTDLSEEQRENLITAKSSANSLLNIINDILDFSKLEAGKLTITNTNFDIRELIEETVKAHTPRAEEKGLELSYTFSSSIPRFVNGDPNRLRQVINNLISNALKFTEKGSISVTVKKLACIDDKINLKFSVTDTGIGISPEDLNKLFQSFSQIETSFTRNFGGTGLGLAISRNIIELMGGKIGVESLKGSGSTFYFSLTLPIGSSAMQVHKQSKYFTKAAKPLRILLAEDDEINRKVITRMLLEKGHEADTAENGVQALKLYEYGKYDVILMDIKMPVMNGIEASRKIREKEAAGNHTPIVAITAYALQGDRERFMSSGMDEYITKPIQMELLFDILDRVSKYKEKPRLKQPDIPPHSCAEDKSIDKEKISDDNTDRILHSIFDIIKKLDAVLEYNDVIKTESLAHEIKALAASIDAEELKDEAFRIELAARRGNLEDVYKCVLKLKTLLQQYYERNDDLYENINSRG